MHFTEAAPQFKQKFGVLWNDLIGWISETFNISRNAIDANVEKLQKELMEKLGQGIGQTLGNIGGTLSMVVLLPIYTFMILLYKPMFYCTSQ